MLPAWWTRKGTKLRLTAHAKVKSPKMQGGGGLSLDEIVQFDWEVALGDEKPVPPRTADACQAQNPAREGAWPVGGDEPGGNTGCG